MLGKLLKNEMKATGRTLWPIYIGILLFAFINRFFAMNSSYDNTVLYTLFERISAVAYGFLLFGLVLVSIIIIVQRFYKNLLGDEGYLMFTLPVKTSQLIFSKIIAATCWIFISTIVAEISSLIILADWSSFVEFFRLLGINWHEIVAYSTELFGVPFWLAVIEFLAIAIISTFSGLLMIYAAISFGHLFKKHRLLAAFIGFFIFSILMTFVIIFLFTIPAVLETFETLVYSESPGGIVQAVMVFLLLYSSVFGVLYYFITHRVLNRKLNLE